MAALRPSQEYRIVTKWQLNPPLPSENQTREWNLGMPLSNQDYVFITDVLAPGGRPFEGPGPWGKIVVQIPSHPGIAIGSIEAQAKLVAINAGVQKWPDIVRLRDAGKLILQALRLRYFRTRRARIIDPERGIQPKNP